MSMERSWRGGVWYSGGGDGMGRRGEERKVEGETGGMAGNCI